MPTVFTRILLFISSYSPLFAIFGFLYLRSCLQASIVFFLLALLGCLSLIGYLAHANKKAPIPLDIQRFSSRDEQSMSYIVSYIIPFLAISTSAWEHQVALGCFFLVIGVIYVSANMIHINPMLNLFRWRIYEVTTDKGSVHTLIAKGRHSGSKKLLAAKVGDLFVESKKA